MTERSTSSGYTVLARRYRSRNFDELIGQEPIVRTLRNAIETGRTAHAYLFCGTRGVGKTSMARIFAAALNASDDLQQKDEIIEATLRGDDLDVIEIDGASNRGVDQARDLIAAAGLAPSRCRYRIYIIDEVHMLTKEAFNALLKTMEEPPSHVKFILCTTEAHKVPATIQSRCQRFDFRAIPSGRIADQITHILAEEGVRADDDVIHQVARLGNGSMRDALSLLDRLLAAGDKHLTADLLEQMLGIPDQSLVVELIEAIVAADPAVALERGDELLRRGSTVEQSLELLAQYLRSLLVARTCGPDSELLDVSTETRETCVRQAEHFDAAGLVHLIALCDATARNARSSAASRALFDAVVVRMALSEQLSDVASLLEGGPAPSSSPTRKKKPLERRVAEPAAHAPVEREVTAAPVASPPPPPAPKPTPVQEVASPTPSAAPVTEVKPETVDLAELWKRIEDVATGPERRKLGYLHLEAYDGRRARLRLGPDGGPVARILEASQEMIADVISRAAGRPVKIDLDLSLAEKAVSRASTQEVRDEVESWPAVRRVMDLFDARVVSVEETS